MQVQQQYAVTFTLPLTLSAANLTDAQTQADVLLNSSNATEALATAVAAGLISGALQGQHCWVRVGNRPLWHVCRNTRDLISLVICVPVSTKQARWLSSST